MAVSVARIWRLMVMIRFPYLLHPGAKRHAPVNSSSPVNGRNTTDPAWRGWLRYSLGIDRDRLADFGSPVLHPIWLNCNVLPQYDRRPVRTRDDVHAAI